KPPRMIPDPTFTFDGDRCVVAAQIVDICSGITKVLDGPSLDGDRCCYTICRGPLPPCGRPLVDERGVARSAPIVARTGWAYDGALLPGSRSAHPKASAIRQAWLSDA